MNHGVLELYPYFTAVCPQGTLCKYNSIATSGEMKMKLIKRSNQWDAYLPQQ